MRSTALTLIASAIFGSSLAIAQSTFVHVPEKKPHALSKFTDRFMAADRNGDGALAREEAEAAGLNKIVGNFDKLDVNGDGKVTLDEMRAVLRGRPTT